MIKSPSRPNVDLKGMLESLLSRGLNESTVDIVTLVKIARADDRFAPEFLDGAIETACRAAIRTVFAKGFVDEDGVRHRFLRIEEVNPKTQEVVRGYKQLEFFTRDNIVWAIRDRQKRIGVERAVIQELLSLARTKFGKAEVKRITRQLGLEFD